MGRLGTGLVVDAAVGILTDGIGTAANLRKAEKAAEAVGHVKGAEKGVAKTEQLLHQKPYTDRTGRGKNHLQADQNADGPHTTFRQNAEGHVTHYIEWQPNPQHPTGFDAVKRVDTQHATPHMHHNKKTGSEISTPHAHDPAAPGGVRPATPDELPR